MALINVQTRSNVYTHITTYYLSTHCRCRPQVVSEALFSFIYHVARCQFLARDLMDLEPPSCFGGWLFSLPPLCVMLYHKVFFLIY